MMRKTADFRLVFAAGALVALACGGVSEQDFFDTPTPKRVQTGGAGGMSSVATGGSAGSGAATAGMAATTGGSGGTATASGGATSAGGTTSTGGTVPAGGSGNTAAGGTSSGDAGTGAGNASSSGGTGATGGSDTSGGVGGSLAGAGGSAAGTGGDAGAPMGGAGTGAGQGGMTAMGGAGASPGGRGGRGGGPGMTCAERLSALADKLDAAQACSMAQDAGCNDFVKDECDCEVPVNRASSAESKAYLNAVKEIGDCAECTRSSCENYTRAYCRSSSGGGIMGRCQGVGLTTL